MSYRIESHSLLGEGVSQQPAPGKDSGLFSGGMPDTLVIHFTGGRSLESSVQHLSTPGVAASVHLVIGRDGRVVQLVGFDRVAWHAGESQWKGRHGLNRYSIGIELDNAGRLTRAGDQFVAWFGHSYPPQEVIQARHRNESEASFWHLYTEAQLQACFAICRTLVASYGIQQILGHEEIAPSRRSDPGPAFPLERLREQLLVGRADTPVVVPQGLAAGQVLKAQVNAELLNMRQQPHAAALMAHEPLPMGTPVEVLERSGDWCKVRLTTEGWVNADFLKPVAT